MLLLLGLPWMGLATVDVEIGSVLRYLVLAWLIVAIVAVGLMWLRDGRGEG